MSLFCHNSKHSQTKTKKNTSSQANVNNSWKQLLFKHFKQEQEVCPYVAQPLCQRNMVRAGNTHVGGVKTSEPRIRIRRAARRHRLLEFGAEVRTQGKMRWRPSQLHWSDPPILTRTRRQPHDKHTRRRQVVIFLQKNLSGDEYQRCQGVPCAAGDTPTLWGEETYARSALMQLFWFFFF